MSTSAETIQSAFRGTPEQNAELVGMSLRILRDALANRRVSVTQAAEYLEISPSALGRKLLGHEPLQITELDDLTELVRIVTREQEATR